MTLSQVRTAMLAYYVMLAWRNLRRHPIHALLVASILGVGMGAFITMCSLLYVLGGDPIPGKSSQLLSVRLGRVTEDGSPTGLLQTQVVQALKQAMPDMPMVAMTYGFTSVENGPGDRRASELVRFADAGFFRMFDVPVLRGRSWTVQEQGLPTAVLGRDLAQRLFPAGALGKRIRIGGGDFQVIGILDEWHPMPRFYDLSVGAYARSDQIFLPLGAVSSMDSGMFINRECRANQLGLSPRELSGSGCAWLALWALATEDGQRQQLQAVTQAVLTTGKQEGWLDDKAKATVENVHELLRRTGVVPGGVKLGVLLAVGFLGLCIANASGLLLASCLRRSREIGVRRALGASRRDIVTQFLVEAALLGVLACALGVLFAVAGTKLANQLPQNYARLLEPNVFVNVVVFLFAASLGAIAGLLPAWRASRVQPAIQIKVD